MTSDVNYFIKVKDHINKSERVVNKVTTLDTYISDFHTIINHLNKDNLYLTTLTSGEAILTKTDTVTVPGYIYNSTKTVTTVVYTLSLIKIEMELSELFHAEYTNRSSQTNNVEDTSNVQTKETQSKNETEDKNSQTVELSEIVEITDVTDDSEFGEFQSYTPEFTNVDLNGPTYPYCNNVIVPSYTPYNSYNPFSNTNNPFNHIMNLRGENDDVHFTFGSQVPRTPTQITPSWSPELISELKVRLSQPNAGLLPTNATYYL